MAIFLILTLCSTALERDEVTGGEMAGSDGMRLGVSTIHCLNWKSRNGDEGIRAKWMVIFYSGSVWIVLSHTVITSLVRGESERERGGKKRDSSLCHGCK